MKMRSLLAMSLAFAALGCGSSKGSYTPTPPKPVPTATVAAGEEASLFPIEVGNRWVYDMESKQMTQAGQVPVNAEYTLEVKKVEDTPDGAKQVTIDISRGDVLQDSQLWRLDKTGVYQVRIGLEKPVTLVPPQPAITFPLDTEKTTNWTGKAPGPKLMPVDTTLELVNKGVEDVDTMLGMMSGYCIEGTQSFTDKGTKFITETTTWWVPKVGLARQTQLIRAVSATGQTVTIQTQVMKLKQHTP